MAISSLQLLSSLRPASHRPSRTSADRPVFLPGQAPAGHSFFSRFFSLFLVKEQRQTRMNTGRTRNLDVIVLVLVDGNRAPSMAGHDRRLGPRHDLP